MPGRDSDGNHLAFGFSGHGVVHAPDSGRILAALILGREVGDDIGDLDPNRFAPGTARTADRIMGPRSDPELPEA